jgi:hypothetical protein
MDTSNWAYRFFRAALVRALRTMAQTALAMLPASATIQEVGWATVLSSASYAGLVSLIMSLATGLPEAGDDEDGDGDHYYEGRHYA